MHTTVYFATNRRVTGNGLDPSDYAGEAGPTTGPAGLTFGMAMVEGTDIPNLAAGHILALDKVGRGSFTSAVGDDIAGGRNLLVFIHGFANSFTDSVTRAAFNREFLAASGEAAADCTVLCLSWPSGGAVVREKDVLGGILLLPVTLAGILAGALASPLTNGYVADKAAADASGPDAVRILSGLRPIADEVRAAGGRVFLLVHSMGHRVLRAAVSGLVGGPPLFDEVFLAAADTEHAEDGAGPPFLRNLRALASRVTQYASTADDILRLSQVVNRQQRLGRDGPIDRTDATAYPPPQYRLVDCSAVRDDGPGQGIDTSHQYYRRVPAVRDDIARAMAGGGRGGRSVLPGT
ncbi:alpha/beta hydrolase [Roseomonas sp. CCTCC AB2023176]|uniref:alpha/beta hydrolase n=1 Tax=Roseomonas sp. CCTCC AB2023176 TaxID=3342640 RepID=UPI0035DB2754